MTENLSPDAAGDAVDNGLNDASRTTRPATVDRHAQRRTSDVQRYTIDLDREQRRTLALVAAEWEVDKSKVVRTLLYLLEADPNLRARVQGEIFGENVA